MREPTDLQERIALRGRLSENAGRGPRRGRTGRVCAEPACRTVLSVYNPQDRCWEHTEPSPYLLNVRHARAGSMPA